MYLKGATRGENIELLIKHFLQITLVIAVIWSALIGNWAVSFVSFISLVGTILPFVILKKRFQLSLPIFFELIIVIFVYSALFLGEVGDLYVRFWWWDKFMHTGSGFAFGFAGFLILYTLYVSGKLNISPFLFSVFTFCFALAIGTLWEIFEFNLDVVFGLNWQHVEMGVTDTMFDLIVDSLGAIIASLMGYLYIKHKKSGIFNSLINQFFKKNPRYDREREFKL